MIGCTEIGGLPWLRHEIHKAGFQRFRVADGTGNAFNQQIRNQAGKKRSWTQRDQVRFRNSLERFRQRLGIPRLKANGIGGMPRDITELYADACTLRLRWDGIYTLSNWFALREMRRGVR